MMDNGIDVQIGYVETHGRAGTEAQLEGLPVIPRKKISTKERNWRKWIWRRFFSFIRNWLW